jgi:hypothetical protein
MLVWRFRRGIFPRVRVLLQLLERRMVFRQIRCQVLTNICASADRLRKECRRPGWKEVRYIIFYGFLVMLLWRVFDRVMFESRGEVFTAFVNNLGDLPPAILASGLAVFATIAEFALGLALLLGIWRHPVAWASCGLLTLFALAMTFSFAVRPR